MEFKKVLNEMEIDTGEAGHFIDRVSKEEKEKPVKKKTRSKKRVFGSWFTSHNNTKHINK